MTYIKHQWTNPDGDVVAIYLHESLDIAHIGDGAEIGASAKIGAWAEIGAWAKIGDRAEIGDEAKIGARAKIGAWAKTGDRDPTEYPIYMAPLPSGPTNYYITITQKTLGIGCEIHSLADWHTFSDKRILEMDGKPALEFWKKYKSFLLGAAKNEGWI